MKVGLLIDDHMGRPGGVQEYVRGLARFLATQGHAVVVFSSAGATVEQDIRTVALGSALPLKGSGSSTSIPLTLAFPTQVRSLLERESCDILHVMAPYSPTLSGRLLVHSEAIHVMTFLVAIAPGWYRTLLGALAKLQWRSLRRLHARIAISTTAAETAQALYGGDYQIVPCGVDTADFDSGVEPLPDISRDGPILLYVGRLEQRKGVAHLIQACAYLEQQYPDLRLLIGGAGPERRALEKLSANLGLRRVQFLGYVPAAELPRLFRSATVFCAPATYAESFGIVLIEAMAAGLPIVAAANPGYAGLLAAHPGNLLVPPGDARALAGAVAVLLQQPAYRHMVGMRNSAAAKQYDWSVVGARVVKLYEELLGARR